jgi:thiol-disulfide isomerase/thioredoxin
MNRRNWILAGATGTAAAAAGVAWRLAGQPRTPAAAPAVLDAATTAFWQTSFPQPDGQTLTLAALRGQPLVLNFWATWCPPCVKEMPELDRFARQFSAQGGRVVGLAVDNPKAVREFLQRAPVSYAIALAGFDGTELSRKLGNTTGALPFTAVFARSGALVQRKLGETGYSELQGWTREL